MKSIFEEMGGTYRWQGDYLISNIELPEQESVTEALKAAGQMEWVRRMNSIHNQAEEIVMHELVYEV